MKESTHLRLSLGITAGFLLVGLGLEVLHGLRTRAFMDDPLQREFLRLGHAHGGLLGLVNMAMAFAMARLGTPDAWATRARFAGVVGALIVGLGFIAGGLTHGPTDPGPVVLVVPAGALLVLCALVAVAVVRRAEPRA